MVLKRVALVLAGLAIASGIGEVAVRYLTRFHETAPAMFATAPDIPWQLRPDTHVTFTEYWGEFSVPVDINARGYREREFPTEPAPGTCRVLAMGDSFTFGHGVRADEAYVKVLERALNATGGDGTRYETINAGYASGYAPDTALVYFRHRGVLLHPNVVLIGFFEGNDLIDELDTAWPEVDERGWPTRVTSTIDYIDTKGRVRTPEWLGMSGAAVPTQRALAAVKLAVRDHSELTNFLLQRFRLFRAAYFPPSDQHPWPGLDLDLQAPLSPEDKTAEAKARKSLDGLREWTRRAGATLVVISIPEKGERQASAFLRAWSADTDTPLIDLGAAGDGQVGLYFVYDGHWTAAGQARAGAHIADALQRQGLLNACPRP